MVFEVLVTYQCWVCGSSTMEWQAFELPLPQIQIWNLCKECQNERGGPVNSANEVGYS